MKDLKELCERRSELRKQMSSIIKENRDWTLADRHRMRELQDVHLKITVSELSDRSKKHEKKLYSVCGYSYKHGYFRNKVDSYKTIDEAILKLNELKADKGWGIPTIIVKETYLRLTSPAMVDFDSDEFDERFPDRKEVMGRHKCGDHKHSWDFLLDTNGDVCY